jgi:hypothetical protein
MNLATSKAFAEGCAAGSGGGALRGQREAEATATPFACEVPAGNTKVLRTAHWAGEAPNAKLACAAVTSRLRHSYSTNSTGIFQS